MLSQDLNRKYWAQFPINKLQNTSAQPVRAADTDYSPLRRQPDCGTGRSRGAGKALPAGTSVTKHPEKLPSSPRIYIARTQSPKRRGDHARRGHPRAALPPHTRRGARLPELWALSWRLSQGGKQKPGRTHAISRRLGPGTRPGSCVAFAHGHGCREAHDRSAPGTPLKELPRSGVAASASLKQGRASSVAFPSPFPSGARCSYRMPAAAPRWDQRATRGAAGRKGSPELTPALNSAPTSPPVAAQAPRGWQKQLRKGKRPGAHR